MREKPVEVVNTHEQLKLTGGGVAITRATSPGRQTCFCGWHIYRINAEGQKIVTDRDAAWYDHHQKTFHANWADRLVVLEVAKAWVAEKYGITGTWVRNTSGDYVLQDINKRFPLRKRKKYLDRPPPA